MASLPSLPQCAEYCFGTGLADNSCGYTADPVCQCSTSDTLITLMTPCLMNLCSSNEMTQAVLWWQALCVLAVSSAVEVPGFATNSMGLAVSPTMSMISTAGAGASLRTSAPAFSTPTPSLILVLSEFSILATQTGLPRNYLVSETDNTISPTGSSYRPNESNLPSPSSSLSAGAKAGIAVGAVAIALIAAVIVWIFCRRRRQPPATVPEVYTSSNEAYSEKIPEVSSVPQIGLAQYPKSPIQRKPVQQSHVYPEMEGGTPISPVVVSHGNELEGQYWPAGHERKGELAG